LRLLAPDSRTIAFHQGLLADKNLVLCMRSLHLLFLCGHHGRMERARILLTKLFAYFLAIDATTVKENQYELYKIL